MKYSATIIFLSLFNLSADASCELSSEDLKLREGFQTIGKTPLWKTFPVGHRFGFKDSRNGDTILILGSNAESESLDLKDKSVLCLDDPPSIRLKIKYHENQGNFIACSKDSEVDDFCPESLRPIQKKLGYNLGVHANDAKYMDSVLDRMKFRYRLSPAQTGLSFTVHEMFHGYQSDSKGFAQKFPAGVEEIQTYDNCLQSDWAKTYGSERKWWKTRFPALYSPATKRKELQAMALELVNTIRPPSACSEALGQFETVEGIAQFVGNLALLRSGSVTYEEFARYEAQLLDVPPAIHSVAYVYATGGAISYLLQRLYGNDWQERAENGASPLSILKDLLNQVDAESCRASSDVQPLGNSLKQTNEILRRMNLQK